MQLCKISLCYETFSLKNSNGINEIDGWVVLPKTFTSLVTPFLILCLALLPVLYIKYSLPHAQNMKYAEDALDSPLSTQEVFLVQNNMKTDEKKNSIEV